MKKKLINFLIIPLSLFAVIFFVVLSGYNLIANNKGNQSNGLKDKNYVSEKSYSYNPYTDSTWVYGKGYFKYRDSLETYYNGYSIPRDSIYKVFNVKEYAANNWLRVRHPVPPAPILDRANHFNNIKMYEEAIDDYDLYIKVNPNNWSAYMNRGTCHERLFHYDKALSDYDMVLKLKPSDTIAHFNKGNIYDYTERWAEAVIQYDSTIMKDPRLAKAYRNRGLSHERLGHISEAIRDMQEAIRLNPRYEATLRPIMNRLTRQKNEPVNGKTTS
jgi:tetratricopeptide (TPR) repeat protein